MVFVSTFNGILPNKIRSQSKIGFTLIELLVVIAIISLLAAILFPVFASAREKSRQTTCASNLKQLGIAFAQYEQDSDEFLPYGMPWAGCNASSSSMEGLGWSRLIFPYVNSYNVYACPDDPTVVGGANNVPMSYAANKVFWNSNILSISKFNAPANTVLLFEVQNAWWWTTTVSTDQNSPIADGFTGQGTDMEECFTNSANGNGFNYVTGFLGNSSISGSEITSTGTSFAYKSATGIHNGGSNWLLCDGHVKWLNGVQVSPGYAVAATQTYVGSGHNSPWQAAGTQCPGYTATFSPT